MLVSMGQDPNVDVYRCSRFNTSQDYICAAPDVRTSRFEAWLIQGLTDVITTPRNVRFLQQTHAASSGEALRLDPSTTADLARNPLAYNAKDALRLAKRPFNNSTQKITIQGTMAVIHSSIPLP